MHLLKNAILKLLVLLISITFMGCGIFMVKTESKQSKNPKKDSIVFGYATELNNSDPFSAMTADARSVRSVSRRKELT